MKSDKIQDSKTMSISGHKVLLDRMLRATQHIERSGITTEPLSFNDEQRDFISLARAKDACDEVLRTLDFHARCLAAGIDDGRRYWCFRKDDQIIGITGYHYRLWDHPDVVWSAWLVVDPSLPALTKIGLTLNNIYVCFTSTQFRAMYIEVLGNGTDSNIYNITKALGMEEVANFRHFHGDGKDMAVMKVNFEELRTLREEKQ